MQVAILGCGYVGLALGRQLLAAGHDVVGVRRSQAGIEAVAAAGIEPIAADLTAAEDYAAIPDADWVVFMASSGGRGPAAATEIYIEGQRTAIQQFGERASPPSRYLYTSSTGVYGDHDGAWVTETTPLTPTTEKTAVLVDAEQVATELPAAYDIAGSVARFAGLYGPERYRLERYLSGPVTEGYLNMVHRADAAGAVRFALANEIDASLLVVDDEPVSKWAFADWLADACEEPEPAKQTAAERLAEGDLSAAAARRLQTSKRCANDRLRELGYEFEYPTYRAGYRAAIEAHESSAGR